MALKDALVIGYGNFDREDDGVAWHILAGLHMHLGRGEPPPPEEGFEPVDGAPDLLFELQLTPELAETVAAYRRVCFVDAHTGAVPQEVNVTPLEAGFQSSPFTHHMTPATCLAMSEALFGNRPEAILVSVRGYSFGFARGLSERTEALKEEAVNMIWDWLSVR